MLFLVMIISILYCFVSCYLLVNLFVTGDNNPSQRGLRRHKLYRQEKLFAESRSLIALFDSTKMGLYFGRFSSPDLILFTSYLQFLTIAHAGTFEPYCLSIFFRRGVARIESFVKLARSVSIFVADEKLVPK